MQRRRLCSEAASGYGSRSLPMPETTVPQKKVGMISLGCAKNLVDAEIMLGGVLGARHADHEQRR